MNQPLVSISCITYNHRQFIRQCLEGFLMQKTSFEFEILIHDDASTDGTIEIIQEYQRKYPDIIKPIIEEVNQYSLGVTAVSLRYNFPRARGKYIALCEGDDYWTDPLKLQKQVDFFNSSNQGYVMSYHDVSLIDEEGNLISKSMFRDKEKKDMSSIEIISGKYMHTSTIMFRNVLSSQLPLESCNVLNGDVFLYALLAHYGGAKYLSNIKHSNYRLHTGGVWSGLERYDRLKHNINTRKQLMGIVEPKYKWVIKRYIFVTNIQMVPFCHGIFPRLKQYVHAYKYFAFDSRYIGEWFTVHIYLLNMALEKIKQVLHKK